MVRITIDIDKKLREKCVVKAKKLRYTLSGFIRYALDKAVYKDNGKQKTLIE